MLELHLLTHNYAAARVLLKTWSARIFTAVVSQGRGWVRLWYLLRSLDLDGRGYLEVEAAELCYLLNCAPRTLYFWLRDGKSAKAFRSYRIHRGKLKVWLGSLFAVCQHQELTNWGAAEVVPLTDILEGWTALKERTTLAVTYDLQEKSRYAARLKLSNQERNFYRLPTATNIILKETSSQEPGGGHCPFILHVGPAKAFVSKAFVPFGASQKTIAEERNISDRTVRRHLSRQKVESRQIVQAKGAYRLLKAGLEWETPEYEAEPGIWYRNGYLREPNGISTKSSYTAPVTPQNFFKYRGKVWRYRCSVYALDHCLSSMRASRKRYKKLISRKSRPGGTQALEMLIDGQEENLGLTKNQSPPPG